MADDRKRAIGNRIRHARQAAQLGREELARLVEVHPGSIARWESGGAEPTPYNLERIANATRSDVAWLRFGERAGPRLVRDAASEAAKPPPEVEDLFANHDQIVKYLGGVAPPGQDQAVKRDILEGIRRAITATSPLPRWWHDLKERVDRGEL